MQCDNKWVARLNMRMSCVIALLIWLNLALLCDLLSCVLVTFPYGVLGQV